MWSLVLKYAISYFESHPDTVANLIDQAVVAAINALKKHNAAA